MQDDRDRNGDRFEPIRATRPMREPPREEKESFLGLVLALGGGLAVVILIAVWWMGRSSNDDASTAQSERPAAELLPEENIDEAPLPSARDPGSTAKVEQAPAPAARPQSPPATRQAPAPSAEPTAPADATPEIAAENPQPTPTPTPTPTPIPDAEPTPVAPAAPAAPALVSVKLLSPDSQVRFELRGTDGSSRAKTGKVGDVVELTPGNYRVVASGSQLRAFEQEMTVPNQGPLEFSVELCAERAPEMQRLSGQVVEERTCASSAQCESVFNVLSEYADQLVRDRSFRQQQCAKWRSGAEPDGRWTFDTSCGGATLATTCRIEITEGACAFAPPRRSTRGGTCPQAELR